MTKTLEACDKRIKDIFEEEATCSRSLTTSAPTHGRPSRQANFSTIWFSAMQEARSSRADSPYFLGNIVLIKNGLITHPSLMVSSA